MQWELELPGLVTIYRKTWLGSFLATFAHIFSALLLVPVTTYGIPP